MSIDYAWYGATADSIRLAARCDANGLVTLTLSDGRVRTETADTAVNDGVVLFPFDLSEPVTGTIEQGGAVYDYTMQIKPLSADALRVIYWSCAADEIKLFHAFRLMEAQQPDLVICLGDFVYADASSQTLNGETSVTVRNQVIRTAGPDAYRPHYRMIMRDSSFKSLHSKTPFWFMWDDHEIFDGFCNGINQANKYFTLDGAPAVEQATTQAHVTDIYNVARQVFENEVGVVNPRNTDAGIDSDALYFRVRVGNLAEFVVPDLMTYRDLLSDRVGNLYVETRPYYSSVDDPLRSMLYPTQKAWYKDSLTNAETAGVVHKLACMSKLAYHHNADAANNGDTFAAQSTVERDELVVHFGTLTSAVWLSADSHQPSVFENPTYDFLCINACPISSGLHQQGTGYNTNAYWKAWGYTGQPTDYPEQACRYVFGMIDITPEKQVHTMVDALMGNTAWGQHEVLAGGSATDTKQMRFG